MFIMQFWSVNNYFLFVLFFYEIYYVTIFFATTVGAPDWAALWSILFFRGFTTFPMRRTMGCDGTDVLVSCNPGIDYISIADKYQKSFVRIPTNCDPDGVLGF